MSRRRLTLVAIGGGILLMQLAWVLALRPFGGIDEFSHFERAASVARGQWVTKPTPAVHGTGSWVDVPSDLVQTARRECAALQYTNSRECRGKVRPDGTTRIATSAGRYNPAFYALVGYPSLLASGPSAVIVMRVVNVLCCWALVMLTVISTRYWARTAWPVLGTIVALTPVSLYSTAVAAPNALEIVAGLSLWSGLLGLLASSAKPSKVAVTTITLAGVVLATMRSLGPLWLLLILFTVGLAVRSTRARVKVVVSRRAVRYAIVAISAAMIAGLSWTMLMHSTALASSAHHDLPVGEKLTLTAKQIPLWLLQSIAAFPYRDQPTLPIVYAVYLVLGTGLVFLGLRFGRHVPRARMAMVLTMAIAALLPAAATLRTINDYGLAWQGRYTLPYTVGTLLLAAWVLDRTRHRVPGRLLVPGALLYVAGQTVSITHTYSLQLHSPLARHAVGWLTLPIAVLGFLAGLGAVAAIAGAAFSGPPPEDLGEPDPLTTAGRIAGPHELAQSPSGR